MVTREGLVEVQVFCSGCGARLTSALVDEYERWLRLPQGFEDESASGQGACPLCPACNQGLGVEGVERVRFV